MQLSVQKLDAISLAELGNDARRLLCAGDIDALAARFGYALALGRTPSDAIRDELASCLNEANGERTVATGWQEPQVAFFGQNSTGLFALVECLVPTENGRSLLLEVIVTRDGNQAHAALEQISAV